MKRKVIFRIREELNGEQKHTFIPEAKGYIDDSWCDISCNSINGDSICFSESIAQTAVDRTKKLIENYGQNLYNMEKDTPEVQWLFLLHIKFLI